MAREGGTEPAPVYAVIFTSKRTGIEAEAYGAMAARMEELARARPGFLGVESARGADGVGITVSYWESLEAIEAWRVNLEHLGAQAAGRERWYEWFELRVAQVVSHRRFERGAK
jgi:heme-degrading monooxygenase HmoA